MATTGSLKTQKPLALRAAAWCRPPLMLNAASDLAVGHHAGGGEGRAGAEHGGLVHAGVGGIVAALREPEPLGLEPGEAEAEGAHGGHIIAGVERAHTGLVGQGRADQQGVDVIEGAVGVQQLEGVPQADGPHGVILAQHVLAHGVVVDEGGAGHGFLSSTAWLVSGRQVITRYAGEWPT